MMVGDTIILGSMIKVMSKGKIGKQALFLLLMIGVGVAIGVFVQKYFKVEKNSKSMSTDGTQVELIKKIQPIPEGKQVFRFSHGDQVVGPKIKTLEISEMKPEVGKNQKVTLEIKNETPINLVALTLVTDVKETKYVLKKIKGTETDGTWSVEWMIDDTYNYKYQIKFDLESASGNYQDAMVFR